MNVLAITGSLRQKSYNTALLRNTITLAPEEIQIVPAPSVATLPYFNPDVDDSGTPPAVAVWREALQNADGVMIFSPEYAHDIPGALKNALDWVVGSGELVNKPVTIVTATPTHLGAEKAHASLAYTIRLLSANFVEEAALRIAAVNQKIDNTGHVTDPSTRTLLQESIALLADAIRLGKQ